MLLGNPTGQRSSQALLPPPRITLVVLSGAAGGEGLSVRTHRESLKNVRSRGSPSKQHPHGVLGVGRGVHAATKWLAESG